ncbi:MAG: RDD family protein [Thermoguttaceae bacterium]
MQTENPYQSPIADTLNEPLKANNWGLPASRSQRFVNYVIDYFFIMVLSFVLGFVLANIMDAEALDSIPGLAWGLLVVLIYFVPLEAAFGRSLGKIITGTKVVAIDGSDPGIGQIIGRTFARMIPFEQFSFLGREAIGWHDRLSGTRVVRTR